MSAWWRSIWVVGSLVLAGCGTSSTVSFTVHERLDGEEFRENPLVRQLVIETTNGLFGDSPNLLRVPQGTGLPEGGRYLGSHTIEPEDEETGALSRVLYLPAGSDAMVPIAGGQALYRRHCLHCHGISGDGNGPTAPFLYPRPRDYRMGIFKFTSTDYGRKPTREDLRRIVREGVHGTSMPAFHAQMTPPEIEQVIDYVLFLSMRGEVERALIEEASFLTDEELADEAVVEDFELVADEMSQQIFARWRDADAPNAVIHPHGPRVPSTTASLMRGQELFLGTSTDVKLECAGCHGAQGKGDGPSWIEPEIFDEYVFGGDPSAERIASLKEIAENTQKRWSDDWEDPLRPANLNRGVYKGGRRPIDLYWRIATGISGTPMPAHSSTLTDPDDIWHLVNFILALPYDEDLLRGIELPDDYLEEVGALAEGAQPQSPPTGSTLNTVSARP